MDTYKTLKSKIANIADLHHTLALMSWDQQVYMPPKGAPYRANQMATLSGIAHDLSTADEFGDLLEQLKDAKNLDDKQQRNVSLVAKEYHKSRKFTRDFVERRSRIVSAAFNDWQKARAESNFSLFQPHLEEIVALKREEAAIIGYTDHPYDPLLDEYEPDAKTSEINALFEEVKQRIVPLAAKIRACTPPKDDFLYRKFAHQKQWDFGMGVLKDMGYDFEAGRQDLSAHPFTTTFAPTDVRVTTRVDEHDMKNMLFSTIHEGGHALYELGLPEHEYGLPAGQATSLAIHESQSRLWENHVGRSLNFWKHYFPKLQHAFPEVSGDLELNSFYRGVNKIEPGFIRTEADELHYHLHVLIRFEIEKKLVEGSLQVSDVRDFWNEQYKEYLGVIVMDDSKGILQDVHWAYGSMGYFPTYSMGSFYAAQFYEKATADIPGLDDTIASGNFMPLLEWLRTNIHPFGKLYNGMEMCEKVTGNRLSLDAFMSYAEKKYGDIYGF